MTNDVLDTALPAHTGWLRPLRWSEPAVTGPGTAATGPAGLAGEFALPVGTVTFLLTDVEGSTSGWQAAFNVMGAAITRHYEILDTAVAAYGGVRPQEQGEGDSIVAAFGRASDALSAAVAAQQALASEVWPDGLAGPIRVRMAIHTGEAQMRDEANYVGQAIIRTARLRAIAHGGQVLVSQAVRDLVIDQLGDQVELVDLGLHRLKDLARPEHVWQVAATGLPKEFPPLKSLDATPNNLPIELSSFVGRQPEIGAVSALVTGNRLVTINGAGGAGKTRLAQQVAAQLCDRYPDGTWWIELAPVDTTAVRATIASVLSINEPERLVERLAGRMLVVLDNCEHVLDVIAPLVHQIMTRCPDVTILATSRGPLDVPGEVTWRIPPLAAPPVGDTPVPINTLAQYEAVRLFTDRARKARPNFELTTDNGPAVAEICARLDGIPLAIELAAARAKSLTAEQILTGLTDALRLLTGGSRLVMPRQQTLEASIGWSYELLGPTQQILLRRLSVFAGGWDLQAAEAICSDDTQLAPMDILDALEHLIDQSLVRVTETGHAARYQLLETVRQFAARQLANNPNEHNQLATRHATHYTRLALEIGPLAEGTHETECVARLLPERDNLDTALRHHQNTDQGIQLAEMALALGPFWIAAQHPADGRTWAAHALNAIGDTRPELRAQLHCARAFHLYSMGSLFLMLPDTEAAITLATETDDRKTLGRAGSLKAALAILQDDYGDLFDAAAAQCRAAGDRYGEAFSLTQKALTSGFRGYMNRTRRELETVQGLVGANIGMRRRFQSIGAMLSLFTADHVGMRAALETANPRALAGWDSNQGLRTNIEIMLKADQGEPLPGHETLETRIAFFERTENYFGALTLRNSLVQLLHLRNDLARASSVLEASLAGPIPSPRAFGLGALFALALGDIATARERASRQPPANSASLLVSLTGDTVTALIARHDGELLAADTAAHRSLAMAFEHGLTREIVDSIELLAGLAAAQGSWAHAARLAGAAHQKRESHPLRGRTEPIKSMLEADLAAARAALGDDAYDAAFTEGTSLDLDDAVAYAQRTRGERSRPTLGWTSLTPTERRVADLASAGRSNAEIAKELLMGAETVKTHLSKVYAKLDVANRTQLAALPTPPGD